MKLVTFFMVGTAATFASASANAACLEKKPEGVAKLLAVANEAGKQLFLGQGFQEVACPANLKPTQTSVDATCQKLDAYPQEAKAFFHQTYGVTTDQFCAAAQAFVAG